MRVTPSPRPGHAWRWWSAAALAAFIGAWVPPSFFGELLTFGTPPHPIIVALLLPAAPFLWLFSALDMDFDLSLCLSGAAGYGVLPLLAWGGWTAFQAYRRGMKAWRCESSSR